MPVDYQSLLVKSIKACRDIDGSLFVEVRIFSFNVALTETILQFVFPVYRHFPYHHWSLYLLTGSYFLQLIRVCDNQATLLQEELCTLFSLRGLGCCLYYVYVSTWFW